MIRFERVTYTYPFQTCPAVSDISFSVRPGELVLCTGASGCGKSTLMRLANGLCPHYFQGTLEGRVLIGGEPTDARPINAIAREVGTLFQDPEQQFFALNVEDELAFAHEWQGVSPASIAAKIDEAAGLPARADSVLLHPRTVRGAEAEGRVGLHPLAGAEGPYP